MKKHEAIDAIDQAGMAIHEANTRVWTTALNPTQNGWGPALLSAAAIPVTNMASLGHIVASAVARQVSDSVYEALPDIKKDK